MNDSSVLCFIMVSVPGVSNCGFTSSWKPLYDWIIQPISSCWLFFMILLILTLMRDTYNIVYNAIAVTAQTQTLKRAQFQSSNRRPILFIEMWRGERGEERITNMLRISICGEKQCRRWDPNRWDPNHPTSKRPWETQRTSRRDKDVSSFLLDHAVSYSMERYVIDNNLSHD